MRAFAILVICLTAACGPSASAAPSPSRAGAPCPVTTAPPVALTPPPTAGTGPNAGLVFRSGQGSFLYGNDALVVLLPDDSTLRGSDPARGLSGGVKLGWYRVAHGDLAIATRRLDAPAAPQPADVPGGYGDTGFQATGVNFPAAGCWEITGSVGGKSLVFVVNVAER